MFRNGNKYLTSNQTSSEAVYLDVIVYLGNHGAKQKKMWFKTYYTYNVLKFMS